VYLLYICGHCHCFAFFNALCLCLSAARVCDHELFVFVCMCLHSMLRALYSLSPGEREKYSPALEAVPKGTIVGVL
jgi:hypothetical protein